jgi:hypothetical protein
MLWTFFVLLLLAWLVCVVIVGITGVAIHLLLIAAGILLITRLAGGAGKKDGN